MSNTRTVKVKADQALANEIAGKNIKRWSATTYSNGKRYVQVTFEDVVVLGNVK